MSAQIYTLNRIFNFSLDELLMAHTFLTGSTNSPNFLKKTWQYSDDTEKVM